MPPIQPLLSHTGKKGVPTPASDRPAIASPALGHEAATSAPALTVDTYTPTRGVSAQPAQGSAVEQIRALSSQTLKTMDTFLAGKDVHARRNAYHTGQDALAAILQLGPNPVARVAATSAERAAKSSFDAALVIQRSVLESPALMNPDLSAPEQIAALATTTLQSMDGILSDRDASARRNAYQTGQETLEAVLELEPTNLVALIASTAAHRAAQSSFDEANTLIRNALSDLQSPR